MMENYEHYITKNIQDVCRTKMISPVIYLILLLALWIFSPISEIVFPEKADSNDSLSTLHKQDVSYMDTKLTNLYFTGYTQTSLGFTTGYYYYTMRGDECILVLLSPSTSEEGLPKIEFLHTKGRLAKRDRAAKDVLDNLSKDLNWTETGIASKVSPYYINEPDCRNFRSYLLLFLYFASMLYALISLILLGIYYRFPILSPPVRQLSRFGKPAELLAEAEEELATLPQLATDDMFITEHYFIETSKYGIAIVPIREIIWVYKHSTLHKFFWYHFSISYTLHITANKHLYIHCPKNIKSDIDGIMDYLAEANHDILVGFSEENRLAVQEKQGTPLQIEKFLEILKKRI